MADPGAADRLNRHPDTNALSDRYPRETLSRHQRITEGDVFRRAFDESKPEVGKFMVLRLTKAEGANRRLGVIASRRTFSRAVDRVRARRLIREAFRRVRQAFASDADVVVLVRKRLLSASRDDVESELLSLAARAE